MYQTLPEVMRPRDGETLIDYWMSFSPLAPIFGIDWRFAQMMPGSAEHTPLMAEASAKMGDAMEDAALQAVAATEKAVEATEAMAETALDDLTQLRGVGPKMARELNAMGITTLHQIAEMGERQVDELSAALTAFRDRPVRDDWVGQAKALTGQA